MWRRVGGATPSIATSAPGSKGTLLLMGTMQLIYITGAAAGQRGCHHQKAWGREAEERPGAQEKISGETMNSINGLGHFVVRDDRQGITARLCHCPQVGLEQHYQVLPLQSDLVSNCVVVLGYTEN